MRTDREQASIYAANWIPHDWIVNLVSGSVEVISQLQGDEEDASYASLDVDESGKQIPLIIDGEAVAQIPVADILP